MKKPVYITRGFRQHWRVFLTTRRPTGVDSDGNPYKPAPFADFCHRTFAARTGVKLKPGETAEIDATVTRSGEHT